MSKSSQAGVDETDLTEITIQPDGRIYVFGASLPILQILQSLQPKDRRISAILRQISPGSANREKNLLDSQEVRT
jgi:hypothetical protein